MRKPKGSFLQWTGAQEAELQRLMARGLSWVTIDLLLDRKRGSSRRHSLAMGIRSANPAFARGLALEDEDPFDEKRDAAFVAAIVREAHKLGLIKIAA